MKTLNLYRYTPGPLAVLTAMVVFLQISCTKHLLEPTPLTSIPETAAFSTPDKILAAVNGLYEQLESPSFYGGRFVLFNEQRGDEFSQNDGNNSTGANVWNQSISGSGDFVNAVWNVAYASINAANIIIGNLASTDVIADTTKTHYVAEAKFVRAFSYLSLVQTYATPYQKDKAAPGLPLRLQPNTKGGENDLAFSTVDEVYQQILKDLDEAEAGLPTGYNTSLLTISRATKAAAIALKTRVYLIEGNDGQVLTEAQKIAGSTSPFQYTAGSIVHRLEANIATVFSGTYSGPEALLSLPFVSASETPDLQSALAYNYLYPILPLNTEGILADPVFATSSVDARKSLLKTNGSGQVLLNKFSKNTVPFTDYIPLIRYSEVLLNYAEAAARQGQLSLAQALLKAVRSRADPTFQFADAAVGSKDALLQTILTERRIELLGEGFRSPDLHRLVKALPAKKGNAGTAPLVAPTDENYVWAIPSSELAYNKLAPQ